MSRAIRIDTVRVGDLHPGDVIRFQHPLDAGRQKRKSNWLIVTEEPKLTDENKVVLTFSGPREAKVFPSPYELVELQVVTTGSRRPTATEEDAPEWAKQRWLVDGHWRRDREGNMHWVEPHVTDPEQVAQELSWNPRPRPEGKVQNFVPGHWREFEGSPVWIEPYPIFVSPDPDTAEAEIAAAMEGEQELIDLKFQDVIAAGMDESEDEDDYDEDDANSGEEES